MSLSKESKGNKWKGYYESARKYKPQWQKKHPWVTKAVDGKDEAYCSLCKVNINPKLCHLQQHEATSKHKKASGAVSSNRKIVTFSKKDDEVLKKLELAVAITCHCAIRAVDHFGEIIVKHGDKSKLGELKLHRTKCSQLIKRVISPALYDDLRSDVSGKKFSVLVDESTDVSCTKYLCVTVRYFSEKQEKIRTAFINLVSLVSATGEDIFNALKLSLEDVGLKVEDCVGLACDGASVMVGKHDSVWSRMKIMSPNCILMKCICHSLALCIKHAFEKLPANLGFLLSEIPKWFSKSTIRREAYQDLFKVINGNDETIKATGAFQKNSTTRWLVRGKLLYSILVSWEELKTYFSIAELEADASRRYKARLIAEMLKDNVNILYFHFVTPIVNEFDRVNAFFQATDLDPDCMIKELNLFYNSLTSRVYLPDGSNVATDKVDYGAKYLFERNEMVRKMQLTAQQGREIDARCHQLLLEAAAQVTKRLPDSNAIFQSVAYLSPSRVLNQVECMPLGKLPMQHLIQGDVMSTIDEQYRKI